MSWSRWFSVWSNMAARLPRSTGRSRQDVSALLHFPADLLLDPQALDANQARGQAQFFRQSRRPCFGPLRAGVCADDVPLVVGQLAQDVEEVLLLRAERRRGHAVALVVAEDGQAA